MTQAELDQLTAGVFCTPDGKRWIAIMEERADAPMSFHLAEIKTRIERMRERWRTGSLTPS